MVTDFRGLKNLCWIEAAPLGAMGYTNDARCLTGNNTLVAIR